MPFFGQNIGRERIKNCKPGIAVRFAKLFAESDSQMAPHPVPLPIRWGEGGRKPGEGLEYFHPIGLFCDTDRGFGLVRAGIGGFSSIQRRNV